MSQFMEENKNLFLEIKKEIDGLEELSGVSVTNVLLPIYKKITEGKNIEERLETISTLWKYLEEILNTTDRTTMHPHFKQQKDPEQSKKALIGNAWELIFETLSNEFLESLGVKVIRFSKENVEKFIEEVGLKKFEERFSLFKERGLLDETRFSKGRIVESFYEDMIKQLKVYIDDEYKVVVNPDCDLIIFKHISDGTYTGKILVLAVLSSKRRFRERIAQVGYWTIKFRHSGSKIKNLLVTPDEDKTFLKADSDHKKIAEIDTDGTYVVYPDIVRSLKIKHLKFMREDIKKILDERKEEIEMYENYGKVIEKLLGTR